jgi:hypothetical protein
MTVGQHIGGEITAIHIQARLKQRNQEATRPASEIECWLPKTRDTALIERKFFGRSRAELGPPLRDKAIMPGLWLDGYGEPPV